MIHKKRSDPPFASNLWKKFWDNVVELATNPIALVTGFLSFLGCFVFFPKLFNEGYYDFFFSKNSDLVEKVTKLKSSPIDFISSHFELLVIALVLFAGLTVLGLLVQSSRSRFWSIIIILYICIVFLLPLKFAGIIGSQFAEVAWKKPSKCFHFYMEEGWPPSTYAPSRIVEELSEKNWMILFVDDKIKHIYQIKEDSQESPRIEAIPIEKIQKEEPCKISMN